jgi:hypothetical protein
MPVAALAEGLVRGGYDLLGVGPEPPEDPDEIKERLGELNQRRPGTGAIHVTFVEAPSLVGFGTAYARIRCTVYGPAGQVLLDEDLPVPERRSFVEAMVLPALRPDVDGRRWGEAMWATRVGRLHGPTVSVPSFVAASFTLSSKVTNDYRSR